ncbi:SDR family NAD(P)-dependent oxidoreductase [Nocardioides sp. ChNu-153]|uniref:oxidoreductase n=1 Tax=unclassified Nocardioides TaxID=2615069 RepID=UPI0024060246|nr:MULTISPECIES: oxidoreductase [unclassified Nocardioides]MDF9715907.1 SDR family NAD(P)-dependent oxidoreductase [Nocardioides sp. ChNu-99]MDN7121010.1 SDR family NAD(P)-dependent oxidoreductase [Nocardioides sp. ChNu-153]
MSAWSLADVPSLTGRTVVVTGPTSGLGEVTALELARAGARVVLAARSEAKLDVTEADIRREVPGAQLERLLVDLSSLASVRAAGAAAAPLGAIDVLVNNAGVMATPARRTDDGLDLQMATNHFGPFLLTGLLLPQLVEGGEGRVVTVSSMMHTIARTPPLGDPRRAPRRYSRWGVYGQTKLANLLFTHELQRRATAAGLPLRALAAHPGYASTHLLSYGQTGGSGGGAASILDAVTRFTAQSAAQGAQPTIMAATADLPGGTYCGPGGFRGIRGKPRVVGSTALSRDAEAQRQLWELSEETVGLTWP